MNIVRRIDKIVFVGLLGAIVFTALAHGAVEAWSVSVFELLVLILLFLWSVRWIAAKEVTLSVPHVCLPVAALLAVGIIQSVAIWGGDGRRLSLSLDVEGTRLAVMALFFLFGALLLASNFLTQNNLRLFIGFLVIFGLVLAVFSLIQHFTWDGRFYWLRPNTQSTSPFGPFVNHNHFAGYMEMLSLLPAGMAVTGAVRGEKRLFYGFAAVMMATSLVFSLSRGGIVSLFAGLGFLIVGNTILLRRQTPRAGIVTMRARLARAAAPVFIVTSIILSVVWIGAEPVLDRVAQTLDQSAAADPRDAFAGRDWIWQDTLEMIKAKPILGVGFGAYETAYSIFSLKDRAHVVGQAHNDYLQIVADCGIVGGAIAVWFVVVILRGVARGARSTDPFSRGAALGSGAAIFAILVHSLFDFNLQLPSNALLFLMFAVLATSLGNGVRLNSAYPELVRVPPNNIHRK